MSQQEFNYDKSTSNQEQVVSPMDLLFDEEWLRKAVEAENTVSKSARINVIG